MKKSIRSIIHLQILIFSLLIILILLFSTAVIYGSYQKKRISADFRYELGLAANDLSYRIIYAEENLKALSSRSMIKSALSDLTEGTRTLDETRKYTQDKYAEGAAVYNLLIYARRLDSRGRIIAEYPPDHDEYIPHGGEELSFFSNERGCHILLSNPIVNNGKTVGSDQAVFFLIDFSSTDYNLIRNLSINRESLTVKLFPSLVSSYPLEGTGYYLRGELDIQAARRLRGNAFLIAVIQALLIIFSIALVSYLTIMRSIIRLIREDEEIREKAARQEKEALVGQIISGLSHEINNVLTGIYGLVDLLSVTEAFPEEGKAYTQSLSLSSNRMARFIRKLTDYNRQSISDWKRLDLSPALEKILTGEKEKSGPEINITLDRKEQGLSAGIGFHHLQQVLSNLFENSRSAMNEKGTIGLILEKLDSLPERDCPHCDEILKGHWIRLQVRDSGYGISPKDRDRIFDPFFSTTGKEGLGLSQASGIITRYGGHILLEDSTPGETVITILLPPWGEK
ncbi:MAG: HAMP domain-containing histidine kinase [Spirochaetales bacterium]|nr:HAMP domain-containing histidine kinase [Spirochaetales bacterium]